MSELKEGNFLMPTEQIAKELPVGSFEIPKTPDANLTGPVAPEGFIANTAVALASPFEAFPTASQSFIDFMSSLADGTPKEKQKPLFEKFMKDSVIAGADALTMTKLMSKGAISKILGPQISKLPLQGVIKSAVDASENGLAWGVNSAFKDYTKNEDFQKAVGVGVLQGLNMAELDLGFKGADKITKSIGKKYMEISERHLNDYAQKTIEEKPYIVLNRNDIPKELVAIDSATLPYDETRLKSIYDARPKESLSSMMVKSIKDKKEKYQKFYEDSKEELAKSGESVYVDVVPILENLKAQYQAIPKEIVETTGKKNIKFGARDIEIFNNLEANGKRLPIDTKNFTVKRLRNGKIYSVVENVNRTTESPQDAAEFLDMMFTNIKNRTTGLGKSQKITDKLVNLESGYAPQSIEYNKINEVMNELISPKHYRYKRNRGDTYMGSTPPEDIPIVESIKHAEDWIDGSIRGFAEIAKNKGKTSLEKSLINMDEANKAWRSFRRNETLIGAKDTQGTLASMRTALNKDEAGRLAAFEQLLPESVFDRAFSDAYNNTRVKASRELGSAAIESGFWRAAGRYLETLPEKSVSYRNYVGEQVKGQKRFPISAGSHATGLIGNAIGATVRLPYETIKSLPAKMSLLNSIEQQVNSKK